MTRPTFPNCTEFNTDLMNCILDSKMQFMAFKLHFRQ